MEGSTEMKALNLDDRPANEGRVALEVSVNCHAEKTSYFGTICAEIADPVNIVLLGRSLCLPALRSTFLPLLCHHLCQSYSLHPLTLTISPLPYSTNLPCSHAPP